MSELKKTVISAAVLVLVMIGACVWGYTGWGKYKKVEQSVDAKKIKVTALRAKLARIPQLRQEKNKLQDELTEYETILPNDRELDKIFDTLSEFTKDSGVIIAKFKPERERQKTGATTVVSSYKRVSYSLKLYGDFFEISKFFNLLENYKRFVRVDSFEMGKRNLDDPLGETKLQVSTFVYDPKAKPTGRSTARAAAIRRRSKTKATVSKPIPFVLADERAGQYIVLASDGGIRLRSPFTNPLTRRHTGDGPDKKLIVVDRKLTPAEEQELVKSIQSQLSVVAGLINTGDFDKAVELFAGIQDRLAHKFLDPATATQVVMIRLRAAEVGHLLKDGRGKKLYETVKAQYGKMTEAFEVGDYDGVSRVYSTTVDVLKKAENVDYKGLAELTKAVSALADRARICSEFASLDIDVQGVIWMRGGRAAAIINKQSLIPGDKLKLDTGGVKRGKGSAPAPEGDIFIHEISRGKITFRYKGERIAKILVE